MINRYIQNPSLFDPTYLMPLLSVYTWLYDDQQDCIKKGMILWWLADQEAAGATEWAMHVTHSTVLWPVCFVLTHFEYNSSNGHNCVLICHEQLSNEPDNASLALSANNSVVLKA